MTDKTPLEILHRAGTKYIGCLVRGATYSDNNGKEGKVIAYEIGERQRGVWLTCQHESGNFFVYRRIK